MRLNPEGLFIKISGVTSEEDALFSIGLGASAVGFDFALTARQISVNAAHDIVRRLPQGAVSVGVFRNELPQRIVEIANTLGLSAVQIDGPIPTEELSYISERVNTVLRMVPDGTERLALLGGVDYLVLPESDEQEALVDSLELLLDSGQRVPLIASGGLSVSSVVDVVQNFPVFGVDVRAGVESAPGVKDPVLLGQFIANARWAYDNAYVERHFDEWSL
ncbi:MAG TPA: phosphoribosylanthranilate isomerase [Acidimicrobiales bacterium]|nr:phosphoribosylanthranilate isomerase [Acidimicrobiales bacterium]